MDGLRMVEVQPPIIRPYAGLANRQPNIRPSIFLLSFFYLGYSDNLCFRLGLSSLCFRCSCGSIRVVSKPLEMPCLGYFSLSFSRSFPSLIFFSRAWYLMVFFSLFPCTRCLLPEIHTSYCIYVYGFYGISYLYNLDYICKRQLPYRSFETSLPCL